MNKANTYLIGIDGGGTSCRCRLTDSSGNILAETKTGSANVFQNPEQAWQSVSSAIELALQQAGLADVDKAQCYVVAGLAGAEVTKSADMFMSHVSGFAHFELLNDAQIACLGAHSGGNGAVFIIGTGTIGIAIRDQQWSRVGGWGFPLDDTGSGAWLGQQAIRSALFAKDGREAKSLLSDMVWQQFPGGSDEIITWSLTAKSGDYGKFAPTVIAAFEQDDARAIEIVTQQIESIRQQINALNTKDLPLSLMGGLAPFVSKQLLLATQQSLANVQGDALSGALAYAAKRIKA